MSTTQKSNWIALAGLVVIVLKYFGVEIAEADVQVVIGAIISIVGVVTNYVHRYNQGDVTALGGYKK